MESAFGVVHKAAGPKDAVHRSQARDSAGANAEDWSATHTNREAAGELNRRATSRRANLLGSYRVREVYMRPGGPSAADRPVGHIVSEHRPLLSRKRVWAAGAVGAGATAAAIARHRHTRASRTTEQPPDARTRGR